MIAQLYIGNQTLRVVEVGNIDIALLRNQRDELVGLVRDEVNESIDALIEMLDTIIDTYFDLELNKD